MKSRKDFEINNVILERILKFINEYQLIKSEDRIVLGVSGGPDSIFMLDTLRKLKENKKLNCELIVAHVNHMIREEAIDDEQYVVDYCKKNNIECYAKRIDVQKYANNNKVGTEEAGRILRYQFFDEILKNTNSQKIAIAHNKNDKAETIIMNLLRGSGLTGLKGIEPIRNNKYIRPILGMKRNEIEEYCEYNSLNPRIDKTNFENTYTRNKIRNIIIPYIKEEFNPNIIDAMDRLSQVVTEEEMFLEEITKNELNKIIVNKNNSEIILDLKKFNGLNKVIQKRIVFDSMSQVLGNSAGIEKIHIDDVVKLCNSNVGNKFTMPNKNIKVLIKDKKIFFTLVNEKNKF